MKFNQKITLILILLGLVFSSMIRIRFNLSNGITFHEFWIKLIPFPLFDYGAGSPFITHLTTTFLGYLFFMAAGIYWHVTGKRKLRETLVAIAFIVLTMYALYYEGNTLLLDHHNEFTGQHMRIGPVLCNIGIGMVLRGQKVAIKNTIH